MYIAALNPGDHLAPAPHGLQGRIRCVKKKKKDLIQAESVTLPPQPWYSSSSCLWENCERVFFLRYSLLVCDPTNRERRDKTTVDIALFGRLEVILF